MNLFTYGSLMYPEIWNKLFPDFQNQCMPCQLKSYRRLRLKDEPYPGLVPGTPSDIVEGIIYFNIRLKELALLDDFEGEFYTRAKVICTLHGGLPIEAETYLFREECRGLLGDENWDPECFEKAEAQHFYNHYKGSKKQEGA